MRSLAEEVEGYTLMAQDALGLMRSQILPRLEDPEVSLEEKVRAFKKLETAVDLWYKSIAEMTRAFDLDEISRVELIRLGLEEGDPDGEISE